MYSYAPSEICMAAVIVMYICFGRWGVTCLRALEISCGDLNTLNSGKLSLIICNGMSPADIRFGLIFRWGCPVQDCFWKRKGKGSVFACIFKGNWWMVDSCRRCTSQTQKGNCSCHCGLSRIKCMYKKAHLFYIIHNILQCILLPIDL